MQQLAKDPFRPTLHFTPPFGWMNDPNGLVYVNNEYHLFYQYFPYANKWGPMHWGHAVSADLRNWQHLPPALVPDEKGMCFSGSAVVDWRNTSGLFDNEAQPGVLAFYTACIAHDEGRDSEQMQSLAYSKDGGFSWNKLTDNPILPNPGLKDFRDPKVIWHEQSQHWVMVVTEGQEIGFYRSKDLKQWEKTSIFGLKEGKHDEMPWECPDLFPIQLEGSDACYWVLIVGVQRCSHAGGSGTQYFIGDFDGEKFTTEQEGIKWVDWGTDNYAGVTYNVLPEDYYGELYANDPKDQRIFMGWMNNWTYARDTPTEKWRGAATVPRKLSLKKFGNDYELFNYPIEALDGLLESAKEDTIEITENGNGAITNENFNQSDIRFVTSAKDFGLSFRNTKNDMLELRMNKETRLFTLDRANSGQTDFEKDFSTIQKMPLPNLPDEEIEVRIVMDHSSIEIFINEGQYVMTAQIFPNEFYTNLEIMNHSDSKIVLKDFKVSKIRRVW